MNGLVFMCPMIGSNLRKIRMKKNWMQIDVAAMTDMDRSYISRIENGKARLTIKKFYQLVHGLEITSSDLLDI